MSRRAFLVLEDGSVFPGYSFGSEREISGEVVFNTGMTGYQEVLTDPSYGGQLVVMTYPLIGNYGVSEQHNESERIQVAGFIVRAHSPTPNNGFNDMTLDEFMRQKSVPGIYGVDTRAVTRRIRRHGVMMGIIQLDSPDGALKTLALAPRYDNVDFVSKVTTLQPYEWQDNDNKRQQEFHILISDYGLKYNILRLLKQRGCKVTVVPATASSDEILDCKPDGVLLSPGPGDPSLLEDLVRTTSALIGRTPMLGICLGHQIIGRALGATTFKLKFGHRGANHPVKDLETGKVYITSQNHGYAVDGDTLPESIKISHVNLNDGTVEGMCHKEFPLLTIQYHSEGSPGPRDSEYIFDRFLTLVSEQISHKEGP